MGVLEKTMIKIPIEFSKGIFFLAHIYYSRFCHTHTRAHARARTHKPKTNEIFKIHVIL